MPPRASTSAPSSGSRAPPKRAATSKPKKPKQENDSDAITISSSDDDGEEDYEDDKGEGEETDGEEEQELDSEDLDAEEVVVEKKRKAKSATASKGKKAKTVVESDEEDDGEGEEEEEDVNPKAKAKKSKKDDGGKNTRAVKTIVKVKAPSGKADTPIILPTTMEFLAELKGHNDRDWFQENEARFRHAQANWASFVTALVPVASVADWTLPHLPAKDLVHRIYRDVRFSNDKTPYKTNLAVSLSRTGRKGPYAVYYLQISPGRNIMAAGVWQPSASELKGIRSAILADPAPLRKVLNEKKFVELFGKPVATEGVRVSIFGADDQLKNCPKLEGVTKTHKDIDLLKCRSMAVSMQLTDDQVRSPDFVKLIGGIMVVLAPFVQCINEMMMPTPPEEGDEPADAPAEEQEAEAEDSEEEVLVEDSDQEEQG